MLYKEMTEAQRADEYKLLCEKLDEYKRMNLKLDMSRGKQMCIRDSYKDITYSEYTLSTEIDETSAKVVKSGMGIIICRVDCTVAGEKKTMEIALRNENDIWLIDSPTY